MNILLQRKATRDFVDRAGGWTWKEGRARVFANGLQAILFCYHRQLHDMQISCTFPDQKTNFKVSVTDSRHIF